MPQLSPQDILRIWEQARIQHPLERALTIAAAGWPEMARADLARLPLGDLNRRLLQVHEATYSCQLHGRAECPNCLASLEFEVATADLAGSKRQPPVPEELAVEDSGLRLQFRLPDSFDLAAAARCAETMAARQTLLERCITEVRQGAVTVALTDVPETAIAKLAQRLSTVDPEAELLVDLGCATCGHRWQSVLDLGLFLWTEIAAHARRLLREIHTLARAYGWRENEILALSQRRREVYLELLGGVA